MKEIGSFVEMWMDLESVIQSEVSQKEKNKYCILTHIYVEYRKVVQVNLFAGQESICRAGHSLLRCREWTCGHGGKGRMG